jgi:hypothetical protein
MIFVFYRLFIAAVQSILLEKCVAIGGRHTFIGALLSYYCVEFNNVLLIFDDVLMSDAITIFTYESQLLQLTFEVLLLLWTKFIIVGKPPTGNLHS